LEVYRDQLKGILIVIHWEFIGIFQGIFQGISRDFHGGFMGFHSGISGMQFSVGGCESQICLPSGKHTKSYGKSQFIVDIYIPIKSHQ